jgi:hypothetical protein
MTRKYIGMLAGMAVGLMCFAVRTPAQEAPVQRNPIVMHELGHDASLPVRQYPLKNPLVTEKNQPLPEGKRGIALPAGDEHAGDATIQREILPPVGATIGLNFDGIGNLDGVAPPDTNASVGATQVVETINLHWQVFNKTTGASEFGPAEMSTIWTGLNKGKCGGAFNTSDPVVLYDKAADRWLITIIAYDNNFAADECIAVSQTGDATGAYNRYDFSFGSNLDDYPKFGVWPDAYYASYNIFQSGQFFIGADACAYDRTKMLAGSAATAVCFQRPSSDFSLLPSDLDGTTAPPAGEPDFFVELDGNNNTSLDLYKFHVDFAIPANSTFTGPMNFPVNAYSPVCGGGTCIPQLGAGSLDSLGDRLMFRLGYRNFGDHETLTANHSVVAGSSGGVRWYEIRSPNTTPVVFQQGTFAPDSSYRWMGDLAMDKSGDIALGYSVSSSTMHPAIRFTGRVPSDPAGTMETEATIIQGPGSQNISNRWGDYSGMSIDPADDCTFWYSQEYGLTSGDWTTHLASLKFTNCGSTLPDFAINAAPPSQTVSAGNSTSYTVTVSPINGFTGNVALSNGSLPTGVGLTFNPTTITGGSGTSTVNVTTSASTPPGTYTITLTGTSGALVHSTSVQLIVTTTGKADFTIAAAPPTQSVGRPGTTTFTVTITAVNGFNGVVTLNKVTGLPGKVTQSYSPPTITGSGTSTLTLTTQSGTGTGTFKLTISAKSGLLHHNTTVKLTIH